MKIVFVSLFVALFANFAMAEGQSANPKGETFCGQYMGYRSSRTDEQCKEEGYACIIINAKILAFGEKSHSKEALDSLYNAAKKAEAIAASNRVPIVCLNLDAKGFLKSAAASFLQKN